MVSSFSSDLPRPDLLGSPKFKVKTQRSQEVPFYQIEEKNFWAFGLLKETKNNLGTFLHPPPICRCSSKEFQDFFKGVPGFFQRSFRISFKGVPGFFFPISFSLLCRAPPGAQRSPGHPPDPALHSKGDDASSPKHPQSLEAAGLQGVATSNNFIPKQTSGSGSGQMGWSCQQNLGTQSLGGNRVLSA